MCASLQPGKQVLQPVFHSSKEGWRVVSYFRSSSSERLRHAAQVQDVNFETNHATDQIRGLVCHNRSQGRILPHIHPSVSQEVPEVCFRGQSLPISGSSVRPSIITPHFYKMHRCGSGASASSGYSHIELHRRMVDSSSDASVGSSVSRCRSCPHERIGVTAKRQEECAFSTTEDHFLGVAWDSTSMQVRLSPAGIESILSAVKKDKARPVTHCQTVSETDRFYGSSIQRDIFWTAVHETPAVVAKDQRVFPEGQPVLHDQGHAAMLTCLGNVEETLVPVPGSRVGSFM